MHTPSYFQLYQLIGLPSVKEFFIKNQFDGISRQISTLHELRIYKAIPFLERS